MASGCHLCLTVNERAATCLEVCAPHHERCTLTWSFAKALLPAPAIRLAHVPLTIVYWLKYQAHSPSSQWLYIYENRQRDCSPYTLQSTLKMASISEGRPRLRGSLGQRPERTLVKAQSCSVNSWLWPLNRIWTQYVNLKLNDKKISVSGLYSVARVLLGW